MVGPNVSAIQLVNRMIETFGGVVGLYDNQVFEELVHAAIDASSFKSMHTVESVLVKDAGHASETAPADDPDGLKRASELSGVDEAVLARYHSTK